MSIEEEGHFDFPLSCRIPPVAINKRPPGWVESDSDDDTGTDGDGKVTEIEDDEVKAIEDGFVSADEYKRSIYSSVLSAEESKQRAVMTLSDDDKIWLEVDSEARKIKMNEERRKKSESIEEARRKKAYQRSVMLQIAKQERNKVHAKRIRKKREDKIGHAKRDRDIRNTAKFIERLKSYIPDTHQTIRRYFVLSVEEMRFTRSHERPLRITNRIKKRVRHCISQEEESARGSEE